MINKLDLYLQAVVFKLDSFFRLLPRVIIGGVFIPAGWSKLQSMQRTIDYFHSLEIPLASVVAPLTSLVELTFGFFVFVGFYTRLSTLPLLAIMAGATLTAHRNEFHDFTGLLTLDTALYFAILLCILYFGAGKISVEQVIARRR